MICRRSPGRPSTACRALQSRSLAGFDSDYATLLGTAPPLNDASTAHGGEAASTLTLLPKQRGREQTGCCQLLRLGSFLRGLETNLGSRSPVTGPCRNHASPQDPRNRRKRIVQRPCARSIRGAVGTARAPTRPGRSSPDSGRRRVSSLRSSNPSPARCRRARGRRVRSNDRRRSRDRRPRSASATASSHRWHSARYLWRT